MIAPPFLNAGIETTIKTIKAVTSFNRTGSKPILSANAKITLKIIAPIITPNNLKIIFFDLTNLIEHY